jgi:hypothetical protein
VSCASDTVVISSRPSAKAIPEVFIVSPLTWINLRGFWTLNPGF